MRQKFLAIEKELNKKYLERNEPIRGLLVGLLARQHVLFLGPPGTAKSAMTEDLCSRVGGRYFRWLLSRTSAPEELFGPISLKALEQDQYKRVVTGKLPEANVAFLDEIFKCNSAVLNGTLSVMEERLFFNNGAPIQVPLDMAVGASNELPEDREELGALWDRFILRYVVNYLRAPASFETLMQNAANGTGSKNRTVITRVELQKAQAETARVKVNKVAFRLGALRNELAQKNIIISDRRWVKTLSMIKAYAWLEGRAEATDDDLAILVHALWTEPNQLAEVRQVIMAIANPYDMKAQDALDEAMELYQNAINAPDEKATAAAGEANAKLKKIAVTLNKLANEAKEKGRSDERIKEVLQQVIQWNQEVVKKCLGISLDI